MLNTLLRIGEWQSQGKSEWDRFLDFPKIEKEDKHGNPIKNYILPIIFDLDENKVVIESDRLIEYSPRAIQDKFPLKIKGGNNKAIYTAVISKSLNQIYKTFFGKEGAETEIGELYEAIQKVNPALLTESFKIY